MCLDHVAVQRVRQGSGFLIYCIIERYVTGNFHIVALCTDAVKLQAVL